ncbi:MAG TPA: hypothetical protein PLP19_21910 [bacterium]|nr:hypothetical protein [bacterium]HPN46155.1 hypothetical protein [bacterium]
MSTGRYNFSLLNRIFNIWFIFNAILIFVSYLPHWTMPISSWFNISLYFLALLFTLHIIYINKFSRHIYTPFAIHFFNNVISLALIFSGDKFLWGNSSQSFLFYKYGLLLSMFLFAFCVVNYAAHVALSPGKPWILTTATLIFVAGVFIYHYYSFFPKNVVYIVNDKNFFIKSFTFNLLPVVTIFCYGLLNPFLKPRYGEYSHSIMTVLALLSLREVASAISGMKNVYLFGIDQIFLTIALIIWIFLLFKKMNFDYSTTGQIYTQILHNKLSIGNLKIERRDNRDFRIFAAFIYYLYLRKIIIFPILLVIAFIIKYLNPPFIVSINILTFAVVSLLVAAYFIWMYNRKLKNKDFYIWQKSN